MKPPPRPAILPALVILLLVGALWALVGLLYSGLFRPVAQPLAQLSITAFPFAVGLLGYRWWNSDTLADWTQHALALGVGAFLFYFLITF